MMGKGARLSPKPSLQEAPEIEGGILEEMDQTMTLNQIVKPRESRWTEQQEQKKKLEPVVHDSLRCGVPDNESYQIWLVRVHTDTVQGYKGRM